MYAKGCIIRNDDSKAMLLKDIFKQQLGHIHEVVSAETILIAGLDQDMI